MKNFIAWALTTVVGAFVGSYLGGYLKRKGENLATKEDFDQVIAQLRATTEAAKRIEAQITNESWDRQTQWQIRKDILFQIVDVLSKFEDVTMTLVMIGRFPSDGTDDEKKRYREHRAEHQANWGVQFKEFTRIRLLARLICTTDTVDTLTKFQATAQRLGIHVFMTEDVRTEDLRKVQSQMRAVIECIRKELGIKDVPSAVP